MPPLELDEILGRLRRLNTQVTAYGHILIASELDRPLPAVIPLLVSEDLNESEAGVLVKDILRRGGAALVGDLEEAERLIRQAKKDPQLTAALRAVRLTFRHAARLNAAALVRKMERAAQSGGAARPEAPSLQKELQAFINGVAYAVREDDVEFEEVFADEDLADDGEASKLPEPSLYKEGPESAEEDPWLRDQVEVYNEILACWGAGETFVPESSPLVRRGMLTLERCAELYHDLLAAGASRLVDRIDELETASGEGDGLRYLRSRIADGLAAGVPRILALLASGEPLPADLDDAPPGSPGALADLAAYLTRAAALFDEASPQRGRLGYLASELGSALKLTSA